MQEELFSNSVFSLVYLTISYNEKCFFNLYFVI